ncbi:hypothetical protein [Methylobacterium sp. Leaf89]|uniref:hypothetical protein n=1 Tax=Methylobacterium sp. Leaf89 TaxID=1736245 RepID=UPI0006F4DFE5|nr:hypothetical protein [Methylobacterium sp. Leaf89]KQO71036.1 hypothetical protein ASF18_00640 [Methylobacterium sp. Leaf89]
MLLTTLLVLSTLLPRLEATIEDLRPDATRWRMASAASERNSAPFPVFESEGRAVSNWRYEAAESLRPASLALVARYTSGAPAFVARCVKLNNYWCIKKARWNGEIGADSEGHTGFATAADGADAAAQLLRRYYREFGRRSALAIVRRWAPAECRIGGSVAPLASRRTGTRISPEIAPRGIGGTLRARFLARHSRGGISRAAIVGRGGPLRIQPWSPLARLRGRPSPVRETAKGPASTKLAAATPSKSALLVRPSEILVKPSTMIARPSVLLVEPSAVLSAASTAQQRVPPTKAGSVAHLQERFVAESAALPAITAGTSSLPPLDLSVPAPVCGNDETRIRNYATRIAASVGLKVEDDLELFGPDGRPLPNLRPVMQAMSSVELGALRAAPALVETAIERLDTNTLAAANAPVTAP